MAACAADSHRLTKNRGVVKITSVLDPDQLNPITGKPLNIGIHVWPKSLLSRRLKNAPPPPLPPPAPPAAVAPGVAPTEKEKCSDVKTDPFHYLFKPGGQ